MPMIDLGGGNVVNQPSSTGPVGGTGQQWGQNVMQMAAKLGGTMNPFDQMRPQMLQQFQNLVANPSSIAHTPGWQAGLEGVQRSMAAQGYQGSGNMMEALQNYSGDFYNKQLQMLSGLAGGNAAPGAGASLAMGGLEQGVNLIGQGQASDTYQQMMQQIMQGNQTGQPIAQLASPSGGYDLSSGPSIYDSWTGAGSPQPSAWDVSTGGTRGDGLGFSGVGAY